MSNRVIVFDLDGTLLNTLDDLADATNAALVKFGFRPWPVRKFKYLVGDGTRVMIGRAVPPGTPEEVIDRVLGDFLPRYALGWNVKTRPYPGIPELIARLRADGYTLAVVSNKTDDRTVEAIEYFFPKMFHVVVGQKPGAPLKPDPFAVFAALKSAGGTPEDAFYLGDTYIDMETAKNAGIYAAGVTWGFRSVRELLDHGADVLARNAEEVYFAISRHYA